MATQHMTITVGGLRVLSKIQNWQPDHGWTIHFDNEISLYQKFLQKS